LITHKNIYTMTPEELKAAIAKTEKELDETARMRNAKMQELEELLGDPNTKFEQDLKKSEIATYERRVDKLEAQLKELQAQAR